jgi:hypothetical protein
LEILDQRVQSAVREDQSCRVQWAALLEHVAFLLDAVSASHPDRALAERAVAVALPAALTAVPDVGRANMGAYGAALHAWLAEAGPQVDALEGRLCRLRTLAIRLGDGIEGWPEQQWGMRVYTLDAHRRHRQTDRRVWCANLRWAIEQSAGTPEAAVFASQLALYEAMDEPALLRLLEVP